MIPDRSAQSLKTAYKKFSSYKSKEQFIQEVYTSKKEGTRAFRYSHLEENPPVFGPDYDESQHLKTEATKNPDSSQKKVEEYSSDGDSKVEFILAVDDLESVVSFRPNEEKFTYKIGEVVGNKADY